MGKEVKYMAIYNATIINKGDNYFLELCVKAQKLLIPLTEDKPNETKSVFNQLILALKKENFSFKFNSTDKDIYSQIGEEYIKQLNTELKSVYKDLDEYGLIDKN